MRAQWKKIAVLVAVLAVGLTVVAVALGATAAQPWSRGEGGAAACGALMADPAAAKAMAELRAEHRAGMQAWFDKYGQRPTSAEARRALQKLRADHWRDMKAVFGKLGIERPQGGGAGGTGGFGGCGSGGSAGCAAGTQGSGYGMMGSGGGMMGGWSY